MSSTDVDEAIARTKRLVDLFERKNITQAFLVNEIVDVVTPDNIRDVMQCLPPTIVALIREWAKRLPDDHNGKVIFWPLSSSAELSFKRWLREVDEQDARRNGG